MKTEYILYFAVIVIAISFIVLLQLLLQNLKKKMVTAKLQKCIQGEKYKQVSNKEIDKMIKYIENNKNYISFNTYRNSLKTLQMAF
jgi:uncharacterized protein YoxC